MAVQSSIDKVSSQIEQLDAKLNNVLIGVQNDRIAYIQSGYNLFLQAKSSKNLKNSLFPIAIGQLNIGREQLIYSLKEDLKSISNYKMGFRASWQQLTSNENILSEQEERISRIKQSLSFIIRSSQLLSIIYQDYNERWSMLQSIIRINNVLDDFTTDKIISLSAWGGNTEFSSIISDIKQIKLTMNN